MFKKIVSYFYNLKKSLFLTVESVKSTDGDLRFKIRDFGQIMPYELTPSEILDFRIINQLRPKDAYTTGCIITTNNYTKFKFSTLQISGDGKRIQLKSASSGSSHCFSGSLNDLLQNYDYLENCNSEVLKTLIAFAYNEGKTAGLRQSVNLNQNEKIISSRSPIPNIINFEKIKKKERLNAN